MGPSQVKTDASFARAKIAAKPSRLDVRRTRTSGRTCVFFVIIVASAPKRAIHSQQKAPAQDSAEMSLRGIVSGHHVNLSMISNKRPIRLQWIVKHTYHFPRIFLAQELMSLFMYGQKYVAVTSRFVVRMLGCARS